MSKKDQRYVSGACCNWHGSIHETKASPPTDVTVNGRKLGGISIPCCPHCGGPLTECENRQKFDEQAGLFMHQIMGGDRAYISWLQSLHDSGTCRSLKDWDWLADFAKFKAAM